jgi:hypothetical protein
VLYILRAASDEHAPPQWELRVEENGDLTAVLTGSDPLVTVSGESLASLRKQISETVAWRRTR